MDDDRVLAEVWSDCLDNLQTGSSSVQDCLGRYPQQATRFEELLQLGLQVKAMPLPTPTPQMLAAGEQRLLQAVQARAAAQRAERVASSRSRVDSIVSKRAERPTMRSGVRPWRNLWAPLGALAGVVAVLVIALAVILAGGGAYRAWRNSRATPVSSPVAEAPGVSAPSAEAQANVQMPTLTQRPAPAEGAVQPTTGGPATAAPAGGAVAATTPEHSSFLPLAARPIPPTQAMLQDLRGLVQVQAANGAWSAASEQQLLEAGRRIRTGALSAVDLAFYDGSTAHLGPETEVSLDLLGQDPQDLSRVVVLTQVVGETDHHVAPALGANGKYAVNTSSGTGTAKGTVFHVSVPPTQAPSALAPGARVSVDQGAVAVTNVNITVLVVAGQETTMRADAPPSQPVFRVSGEGLVEAMGPSWQIAGQAFLSDEHTAVVGDPQVGDWVHVEGHLLPNGERVADRIVLLHRAQAQRFTLTGEVQARGDAAWTVAGRTIAISDTTTIDDRPGADGMIKVGDRVRVQGTILDDGALLAESIVRLEPEGSPFSFVGVVEKISDTAWVVSGISATVDAQTIIAKGLAVGDIVQVRGVRVPPTSGRGGGLVAGALDHPLLVT